MKTVHITIIGGGFCGIITTVNLLQNQDIPMRIHLVNKGYPLAKGVAYDPHTSGLLLNVPNGNMSAFPGQPDHFVNWLNLNYPINTLSRAELACAFSTREKYGCYLAYLWQEALASKSGSTQVTVYDDLAYDAVEDSGRFHIYLKEHPVLTTDFVVLATGNDEPRVPSGIPALFGRSKYYFNNPWKKACVKDLDKDKNVLIIGNGLTMADTVAGLVENGLEANIYTVSPHGYNLNPWRDNCAPYEGFDAEELLRENAGLYNLLKAINKHRKIARKLGRSAYSLVDKLRPHVQKIWQSFSAAEKRQFVKKISHLWGSIRHRLPDQMHSFIAGRYAQGRLVTFKGTLAGISERDGQVDVSLDCGDATERLTVQRIINCTGPESSLEFSDNELLRTLYKIGLIRPDELKMGIHAEPGTVRVIAGDGSHKSNLFVIGGNLKGVLWESVAVPELRVQAKLLAAHLAEKCNGQQYTPQQTLAY